MGYGGAVPQQIQQEIVIQSRNWISVIVVIIIIAIGIIVMSLRNKKDRPYYGDIEGIRELKRREKK